MSNPFIGEVCMFGGNFAPRGYAFCNGQLLPIAQNQALFTLLGTVYGGDGVNTFALPNLQSRLPVDDGQGPGLSSYALGQNAGVQNVTITTATMPAHNHMLNATTANATATTISPTVLPGQPTAGTTPEFYAQNVNGQPPLIMHTFATSAVGMAGGSQPHTNLMPSLCISFIIALVGIYPSRN